MFVIEVKNSATVIRAIDTIPEELRKRAKEEMAGLGGLGVEYKRAIAKTARPTQAGAGRRFEKWFYSQNAKSRANQLIHAVEDPGHLDGLTLKIFATEKADIQAFGGTIVPKHKQMMPVASFVGDRSWEGDAVKRFGFAAIGIRDSGSVREDVFTITMKSGTVLLVARERLSDAALERGDAARNFRVIAVLRRRAVNPGGKVNLGAAIQQMEPRKDRRFNAAARAALRSVDRIAA